MIDILKQLFFLNRIKVRTFHLLIIGLVYTVWTIYMYCTSGFQLFMNNWPMSITMVFGSFISGATCEGGGAFAFPVMTLLFNLPTEVARNFALAIQSIGMTSASLIILKSKIPIEKRAIIFSSLGGIIGFILGTFCVVPKVQSKTTKLIFVTIWLTFGLTLWIMNKNKSRVVYKNIQAFSKSDVLKLVVFGMIGGGITSIFGDGINIITFCLLTLHYKVSEKVATPTSVILMSINTVFGFLFHMFWLKDFQESTFNYWLVCIPIVVIFAPIGALVISGKSRMFIARFLYFIILLQFVSAFVILKPALPVIIINCAIFIIFMTVFIGMVRFSPLGDKKPLSSD